MKDTRRNFLQKISLAGAIIPLVNIESQAKYEGKKLRVALVGLGSYATNNLLPGILKSQMCELAGIVTGTPAKKIAWVAKHNLLEKNCYNYENFDEIKNNPDIDAVYIVLPNSMHKESFHGTNFSRPGNLFLPTPACRRCKWKGSYNPNPWRSWRHLSCAGIWDIRCSKK